MMPVIPAYAFRNSLFRHLMGGCRWWLSTAHSAAEKRRGRLFVVVRRDLERRRRQVFRADFGYGRVSDEPAMVQHFAETLRLSGWCARRRVAYDGRYLKLQRHSRRDRPHVCHGGSLDLVGHHALEIAVVRGAGSRIREASRHCYGISADRACTGILVARITDYVVMAAGFLESDCWRHSSLHCRHPRALRREREFDIGLALPVHDGHRAFAEIGYDCSRPVIDDRLLLIALDHHGA